MYENITVNTMLEGMTSEEILNFLCDGIGRSDINRIGPSIETLAKRGEYKLIVRALRESDEWGYYAKFGINLQAVSTAMLSGCLLRLANVSIAFDIIGKLLLQLYACCNLEEIRSSPIFVYISDFYTPVNRLCDIIDGNYGNLDGYSIDGINRRFENDHDYLQPFSKRKQLILRMLVDEGFHKKYSVGELRFAINVDK